MGRRRYVGKTARPESDRMPLTVTALYAGLMGLWLLGPGFAVGRIG